MLLPSREHLAGDDVEERQPVLHGQQRLGPIEPHGRGQAAVELDHHGLGEGGACRARVDLEAVEHGQVGQRFDVALADLAGRARGQLPVVVLEHGDRLGGGTIRDHPVDGGAPVRLAHDPRGLAPPYPIRVRLPGGRSAAMRSLRSLMILGGSRPRTPSASGSLAVARPPCARFARSWCRTLEGCGRKTRGYRGTVLEVDRISKRFGAVQALDGVSLAVERGQMVGFLGPNGAGKSTTMRAILGLLAVDAGTVTWDGASIDATMRSRIGYMPAERGLYPSMRVREHVEYFAALAGMDDRSAIAAAERWLVRVGLDGRADTKVQDLSSGNQQRVQLVVALVHDPELLVLDEPFSGLDPVAVAGLKEILVDQVRAGAALLFSSHQLDVVEDLTRAVVIVDRGRVVLAGDVDELRTTSAARYVAVSYATPPDAAWEPPGEVIERTPSRLRTRIDAPTDSRTLFEAFASAGEMTAFSFTPPELSEVFLEAIGTSRADEIER